MFKYRFACTNKDNALFRINQMMVNDLPCGKSIFGGGLYSAGIHFERCDEIISGFYLHESEEDDGSDRGAPIRVCFTGRFVEEAGSLFFDVHIYPHLFELAFFIFAFVFACVYGDVVGSAIATLVLCFFAKGYYDMINDTYCIFDRIFT